MSEHASAAPADPYAVETRTPEPETELSVLRQTRDATRFIAVCVGVFVALSIIGAIIAGVQLAAVKSQLQQINGNSTSTSNCQSQGGSNPDC
jgi:hypothetical protein